MVVIKISSYTNNFTEITKSTFYIKESQEVFNLGKSVLSIPFINTCFVCNKIFFVISTFYIKFSYSSFLFITDSFIKPILPIVFYFIWNTCGGESGICIRLFHKKIQSENKVEKTFEYPLFLSVENLCVRRRSYPCFKILTVFFSNLLVNLLFALIYLEILRRF